MNDRRTSARRIDGAPSSALLEPSPGEGPTVIGMEQEAAGTLLTFGQPDNSPHTMELSLFVSGANDHTLRLWNVATATELRRVMRPEASFFLNISGSSTAPWLPFELIVRLRGLFVSHETL